MSSNDPFDTNTHNPYSFSDTPQVQLPTDMQRGLMHHVTALSILMIAQGSLVTLYGIGLGVLAFVMPVFIQAQGRIPVRRHLSRRHLSRRHLSRRHLSRRHLSRRHLSRRHLNSQHLKSPNLSRRYLSRRYLWRRYLWRRYLSRHFPSDSNG